MMTLTKLATTGVLALSLTASSLNVAPASAGDNGAGLAIGLGAGLILGGILLDANRHQRHSRPQAQFYFGGNSYDNADYQPACYLGPVRYRWVEDCRQGRYGDLFCHKTKQAFQEQICN